MEPRARIIGLIFEDGTSLNRHSGPIKTKYIHSHGILNKSSYPWRGEIPLSQLVSTDIIITIDVHATLQRHKEIAKTVHLRVGFYKDHNNEDRAKKIMGIIRNESMYIVTCKANKRFEDVSEMSPVIVVSVPNALSVARKYARRFSSTESGQETA